MLDSGESETINIKSITLPSAEVAKPESFFPLTEMTLADWSWLAKVYGEIRNDKKTDSSFIASWLKTISPARFAVLGFDDEQYDLLNQRMSAMVQRRRAGPEYAQAATRAKLLMPERFVRIDHNHDREIQEEQGREMAMGRHAVGMDLYRCLRILAPSIQWIYPKTPENLAVYERIAGRLRENSDWTDYITFVSALRVFEPKVMKGFRHDMSFRTRIAADLKELRSSNQPKNMPNMPPVP